MFQGGRRYLFGVPGVCQTSDRHHHLDKGRKSSFMISCHHCCQRTSSSFTFIFITGKRNRKPESVDWRGSLSNKSCSQERFPVDFQTHKHLSQTNSIMSVDDHHHWKSSTRSWFNHQAQQWRIWMQGSQFRRRRIFEAFCTDNTMWVLIMHVSFRRTKLWNFA